MLLIVLDNYLTIFNIQYLCKYLSSNSKVTLFNMFSLDVKSCHISCIKYHKTSLLSQYSWVVVSLLLSICTITYSCSIFADKIHIFDNVPQNIVICDQSYNEIGSCHGERLE